MTILKTKKTKLSPSSRSAPNGNLYQTTNHGVRISDDHNSLKIGPRGPTLLEDFVLREKITHFDHERIPERVVHARGAGAFGYFECTQEMTKFTNAGFLSTKGKRTPVLVRFSTVAGSRGSADTARDVRGFAVKMYTDEGNFDLVGNNIPVFFIQDAMKFPDLIHAVKPEPHNEIPQAQSAHDTFWDFISLMPESMHMIFWVMSDRAIPRSYRMMEGFGVHTFRFVDAKGQSTFVKFHWKPKLGTHGITWEESLNLAGQDPDFHRRDLWETIQLGNFPEWDLGVQLIPASDEFKFPFDLLDPTKIVPEELVPIRKIGRLVLDRNPDNFFAEIEQAAFHPGNLVPGIDVSNDPLLQGRLFSYIDTQLIRLGGPNFQQIPVNRPHVPVQNNQRDGYGQQTVPKGRVAYEPNSLGGGCPFQTPEGMKAFVHMAERMEAHKVRARSRSFGDHFSQARLFFDSQHPNEQEHIQKAFIFELSKVETEVIRERVLGLVAQVNEKLAESISAKIGVLVPKNYETAPSPSNPTHSSVPVNRSTSIAIEDDRSSYNSSTVKLPKSSVALSMIKTAPQSISTRKIALLAADGTDGNQITAAIVALTKEGAVVEIVAPRLGRISIRNGDKLKGDKSFDIATALMYDAVLVLGGKEGAETLSNSGPAIRFIAQAFKQCKTIAGLAEGQKVCTAALELLISPDKLSSDTGWILTNDIKAGLKSFIESAKKHRVWEREKSVQNLAI